MFPLFIALIVSASLFPSSTGSVTTTIAPVNEKSVENDNVTSIFLNFGRKVNDNGNSRYSYHRFEDVDKMLRNKVDILSRLFKIHIDGIRNKTNEIEIVFLVDASGSVGLENFRSELNFVKKLLSDFTVEPAATRVAVITFAGKNNIRRNVDQISRIGRIDQKCYLLNKQLKNINYTGGGTYTRGALLEALDVLEKGRKSATKVVFLITDGFSNGGDPRTAADLLKLAGVTIFTFGIRTGNIEELHDIASAPGYTHSYLLDSFSEFEALARRALHRDLRVGKYVPVDVPNDCDVLCEGNNNSTGERCCDELATCICGTATGHYSCLCPIGYHGSGFKGFCQVCPNGTYGSSGDVQGLTYACTPCPDVNHVTIKIPATSVQDCVCALGFATDGSKCEVITCSKLKVPENGYLVKASACSNVVNAACGIRCKIGFHLTGDSIRLCRKNGLWSGNEPQCLLKTCAALRAPIHGRMRCQNDNDYNHQVTEDSTAYPIDTRCQFKCDIGYQLRGSKVRNCLPLARWDGLKVTCRAIECEPLKEIPNGNISPENCYGPEKLPFTTNCVIKCKKGFVLEGPRVRSCNGRNGIWSQRHSINRCVDNTPPVIKCPQNVIVNNLPGENYAYVNWTEPTATDNADNEPIVWSKPHVTFPWKVKIGTRLIMYIAQDSNGNKARCKFKVHVLDKEPPVVENCIDSLVFLTDRNNGIENVTWDEPVFYDNSKISVQVTQSHLSGSNKLPLGATTVTYEAKDKYGNSATCKLNIIVEDICKNLPVPHHGRTKCETEDEKGTQCVIKCDDGFGFAIEPPNFDFKDDEWWIRCNANNRSWNESIMPDCSESEFPESIEQEGNLILDGDTDAICNSSTTLRDLSERINEDLRLKLLEICGNDVDCNLISFDPTCDELRDIGKVIRKRKSDFGYTIDSSTITDFQQIMNYSRVTRATNSNSHMNENKDNTKKKKEKFEMKFKFIGKIIKENKNDPEHGILKLREKIDQLTKSGKLDLLNNKTNHEIAKLALNLHVVFNDPQKLCSRGSVLKKYSCVKCPAGTFHNISTGECQPCFYGQYQNLVGSAECNRCPAYTFTKRLHAKSMRDCIPMCQPGFYSQRKRYQNATFSVEPCLMCGFGFYQSNYGQDKCIACPSNTTTRYRNSTSINDCISPSAENYNMCLRNPCLNGGTCTQETDSFSCECRENFIGSKCEIFRNPCHSLPCLNGGLCSMHFDFNKTALYNCTCKNGYTGDNCEHYVDECSTNPCQNGGTCKSTETDYVCDCRNGFEGQFCEVALDHCEHLPCKEGSTCRTINETWQCFCKPGFLGRHCDLLPCDWLPCHPNEICVNIAVENATKENYRCECPDGYTGVNCTIKINYCERESCENGGTCINGVRNYTCSCSALFTGLRCETELPTDYVMHFNKSGTTNYIMMNGPSFDLVQLTVCLWLQSMDTFNYGTILSYATRFHDNTFTLTDYNGFVLYVNGQKVVTDIKVNDGYWHFLCVTWENENGSWSIFVDGILKDNGTLLAKESILTANGSLVIGQEQDYLGGGFSESESFLGKLTLVDIWNVTLSERYIAGLTNSCDKYYGNLYAWAQMKEFKHGDITILESPFCRDCPIPIIPSRGIVNVTQSAITLFCEPGYVVQFGNEQYILLERKCLKHGQWEGFYTPYCRRINCGFPGYFPRGRINGTSYLFGDEIYYSCVEGHELRGNPRRICNSNGKWSGVPPICIGRTCKNLLAPENGDIEYIIEENERDDISILQVGQQLEFKCDPGFRLVGNKYLTCLDSGTWDYERPVCSLNGCPPPKEIQHGYIASVNSNEFNYSIGFSEFFKTDYKRKHYFYGDIIGYSCYYGYKFRENHNLVAEFRLQCSDNGTWIGFVPECVVLHCPWPQPVKNGSVYLRLEDNSTIEVPLSDDSAYDANNFNVPKYIMEADDSAENETAKSLRELFVPGAEILIFCNTGFYLNGSNSRICNNDEKWSLEPLVCSSIECSFQQHSLYQFSEIKEMLDAELINNNSNNISISFKKLLLTIEGKHVGSHINLKCNNSKNTNMNSPHKEILINTTWLCNSEGNWQLLDSKLNNIDFTHYNKLDDICNTINCTLSQIPDNALVSTIELDSDLKNSTTGKIIFFKCRDGYFLKGNRESICHANGTWSTFPECKPIVCEELHPPKNAMFKETKKNYTIGDKMIYQCVPGYRIFGQLYTVCLSNGKWSKVYGRCAKISCGKPKTETGVILRGHSYLFQDKVNYICPNGKKQNIITCQSNGHWTTPEICNNTS